jgi:hypothetical protein
LPLELQPVLQEADWRMALSRLRLRFNFPMLQDPVAGGDMFFRISSVERALTFSGWLEPDIAEFTTVIVGANVGPDIVSFTGSPMTFKSLDGFLAEVFTDFPVT